MLRENAEWDEFHDAIVIDEMAWCGCLGTVWGINGGPSVGAPQSIDTGLRPRNRSISRLYCRVFNATACVWLNQLVSFSSAPWQCSILNNSFTVGSNMASLTTTAKKSTDGKSYALNREKKWITQGQWADHALVAARTGPNGAKGISVFIIPLNTKGISKRKMENSGVSSSGMFLKKEKKNNIEGQACLLIVYIYRFDIPWLWWSSCSRRESPRQGESGLWSHHAE